MRTCFLTGTLGLLAASALFLATTPAPAGDQPAAPAGDTEALARGPVHEAFAEPVDYKPQPGPVVAKKPPDPIDEMPPDQKPEGNDVRWIAGYWAWDGESNDYLWVSGFWRDVPPGRNWLPGAWQEVAGGWQWSPGFWASEESQTVNYVPYPPPSADAGPSTPAPDPSDMYVPGCWIWRETRYLWRPGYWVAYRPDWVWVPARYVWTPGGCVFVDGYWDHPLDVRGLLFCPVRILRRSLAGWVYTPSFVVNCDFLLSAMFVGPSRHHYYFGDYFGDAYARRGFTAWIDYRPTRFSYDPIYNHYRVAYRGEPTWDRNLHGLYRARSSGEAPRPPHTLVQQQTVINNLTVNKTANVNVIKNVNITNVQSVTALTPLAKVPEQKVTRLAGLAPAAKVEPPRTIKVQQVNREQIAREQQQIQHEHQVAQQRREHEAKLVTAGTVHVKPAEQPKATQLVVPKSPVQRPAPVVKPPPAPPAPKHEERAVPAHEPPKPPQPPKPPPPSKPPQKPPQKP
jgi:hypothetical protein